MTLKQSSYLEEEMNQLISVLIEITLEVVVVVEIRKKSFFSESLKFAFAVNHWILDDVVYQEK